MNTTRIICIHWLRLGPAGGKRILNGDFYTKIVDIGRHLL